MGDPSPKPYDDIYPPLIVKGDTWYSDFDNATINPNGRDMYSVASAECDDKIKSFRAKLKDSDYNFRDIASIGAFSPSQVQLYDLSMDPSEEHDLFTERERFKDKAKEMYDHLGKQTQDMSELTFFALPEDRDIESVYIEYTMDPKLEGLDDGKINKWKPWLPN